MVGAYLVPTQREFPLLEKPYTEELKRKFVTYRDNVGVFHLDSLYSLMLIHEQEKATDNKSMLERQVIILSDKINLKDVVGA